MMEVLHILEQKVLLLLDTIKGLQDEKNCLLKANKDLSEKILTLEASLKQGTSLVDELHQEKALTKAFIDDLIKNIDSLVEFEQ